MGGNLADDVDYNSIVSNQANRLLDNIIGDPKEIFTEMDLYTKECVLKDYLKKQVNKFFETLNKEFPDVKFQYQWIHLDPYQSHYFEHVSNTEYTDDSYDFGHFFYNDTGEDRFYGTNMQFIGMRIDYFWERRCSLKCKHLTKRFTIINMPKVLDFVSWIRVGMPVRQFVKDFIPDFFYDPTEIRPKRGRPRKSSTN